MEYAIKRFYQDSRVDSRILQRGLSLEEAKEHCSDPNSKGEELVNVDGQMIRTRFFDGFTEE